MTLDPPSSFLPVSAWTCFGTADDSSPYLPGNGNYEQEFINFGYVGAVENLNKWRDANGCTGNYTETWRNGSDYANSYTSCAGGREATLLTLPGVGHFPFQGLDTQVTNRILPVPTTP